jgi:hypothetical protein
MNTEYTIGKMRIPFASRGRRRWFVGLVYAVITVYLLAAFSPLEKSTSGAWMVAGCGIFLVGLWIVFTWIAGDPRARGDEREAHRRDHAHFVAYRVVAYCVIAAFVAVTLRQASPHLPVMVRGLCAQLPKFVLWATYAVFATLPQAILMWTEPDMDMSAEGAR